MKQRLEAGKIVNTHGIRGDVKIQPWCDNPEFLCEAKKVYIAGTQFNVISARVHKNFTIMHLDGIDSIDEAEKLREQVIFIDRDEIPLPDGKCFIDDIIGFDVYDLRQSRVIGKLCEVMSLPASEVYVVRGESEILIPAVEQFIKHIDTNKQTITVETIEGMGEAD